MNCGAGSSLDITDAITISAWVKPSEGSGANSRIVNKFDNSDGSYDGYAFRQISLSLKVEVGKNNSIVSDTTTIELNQNQWNFTAVSIDSGTATVYINGNSEVLSGNFLIGATATNLFIGQFFSGVQRFDGTIDEVRIYEAALEASQIKARYVQGLDKLHTKGKIDGKEYYQRLTETGF